MEARPAPCGVHCLCDTEAERPEMVAEREGRLPIDCRRSERRRIGERVRDDARGREGNAARRGLRHRRVRSLPGAAIPTQRPVGLRQQELAHWSRPPRCRVALARDEPWRTEPAPLRCAVPGSCRAWLVPRQPPATLLRGMAPGGYDPAARFPATRKTGQVPDVLAGCALGIRFERTRAWGALPWSARDGGRSSSCARLRRWRNARGSPAS